MSKKQTRKSFTPEEDSLLVQLVRIHGVNKWDVVASFMPDRNARQCRERWKSFLSPGIVNAPWTHEEDLKLVELYKKYGAKWAKITKFFVGRSDCNVKNRWQKIKDTIAKEETKNIIVNNDNNNNDPFGYNAFDEYDKYFEEQQEQRMASYQDDISTSLSLDLMSWF
ncbi:Myb-like DNA-binding domain containing protein [Histomonas meleagridis]|uniref:Myb-like DNA-binding domain containing protein n=1 Tax=Histomonas meleagridis TaxID=135588 RepID=UPI00355944F2|nr:Myb-like DNA-binding domain containing protein [Histomonas meleagridis]KAH0804630.1 Myb-like DNA-binding domain containing protein [Histomonas meleagridis]